MKTPADPLKILAKYRSWQLCKVSPLTFRPDVCMGDQRAGRIPAGTFAKLVEFVTTLAARGNVYRCRIGKSRYYYANEPADAARLAAARHKQDQARLDALKRKSDATRRRATL
jgi:hypothetical protein